MPETGNLDMMNKMENAASGLVSLQLHEGWKFRDASGGKWRSATVPGSVHSDLLGHGVIPDPFHGRFRQACQNLTIHRIPLANCRLLQLGR